MTQPPVQLDYGRPDPPKRETFGLSWWMAIPVPIAFVASVIGQSGEAGGKSDRLVGMATGSMIGLVVLSLLVAWIAYTVGRRSRRAANYAFAITMLLLAFSMMSQGGAKQMRATNAANAQMQTLRSMQATAEAAQQKLADAGGVDVVPPKDAEEAKVRLTLLNDMEQKVRAFIDAGDAAGASLTAALSAEGIDAQRAAVVAAQFQRNMQWSVHRPVLVDVESMCKAGRPLLTFLVDRPGKWMVNASGDGFIMSSDQDTAEFNRLADGFADTIEALQRHTPGAATQPQ